MLLTGLGVPLQYKQATIGIAKAAKKKNRNSKNRNKAQPVSLGDIVELGRVATAGSQQPLSEQPLVRATTCQSNQKFW